MNVPKLKSPLGKITIIKTFLLSKLNHLFTTLPSPKESFLKEINTLLYKFIWNDKPDKIKRNLLIQNYNNGGLKMIDLVKFVRALKITWVRRLLSSQQASWKSLFKISILPIDNLTIFGSSYILKCINRIQNVFWKNVLTDWIYVNGNITTRSNEDILNTNLWYNPKISNLFFPNWYKNSIISISDIVNEIFKA